ncbi:hypothetical protein FRD01_15045 [Microvenator marinus]|uniref:Uncharacterized protein n=1 Tax=Microvenator marinus TaxID=2600177 RepID=A0A5B8XSJ9_9DELT|nr:hypothetical protein [Microvenator marinus]QED28524.1 hypothetical protein FRD01_15045 [Microvenator marinus]
MKKLAVEFEFECDEDWDQMTGDERQRFCAAQAALLSGAIAGRSKYFEVYENDKFGKHFKSTERHWRMKKGGIRPRPRDIMILRGDTPNSQDTAQKSGDD